MPAISSGKVLVTGANGYVAMWVVKRLLERGYSVRGTIRSADKAHYLKEYFSEYADRLEIFVVADMTQDGAFDEAVKGVDAVQHIASPVGLRWLKTPKEFIDPAVSGTVEILKSASKHGHALRRIVITSSMAAILGDKGGVPWTEDDWNDDAVKVVEERGAEAAVLSMYAASKTLAEKAAWQYYNQCKSEVKWDMTTVLPAAVFGPAIQEISSQELMNESLKFFWDNVISEVPKTQQEIEMIINWVDVRDLADAHILAMEKEAAGGERIIISCESSVWQDWIEIARSLSPSPLPNCKFSASFPNTKRADHDTIDGSKARRILGVRYRAKRECVKDMLHDFAQRGW
ncbi:D-lactaldehyde dehydrogenase [Coprinopsis sp. MPI-PUGE-AT-0042]|nr:D-lactaldehyde dehydrogenase [Coprinopsis sp. MPI-PUGE-AT-0042]